jgi:transposase
MTRTSPVTRFASTAAYANYAAPLQIASADSSQHRLSRYGDRQLNSAIHTAAMIQIRMPRSVGRDYYDKKIAEGKPPRSAGACPQTKPRQSHLAHQARRRKALHPNGFCIARECLLTNREAPHPVFVMSIRNCWPRW